MKSLQESLFDRDLVSKDTGKEFLYGLINNANIRCEWKIDYFDEPVIKHDFNQIMKKFELQDWNNNRWMSMKKTQINPSQEYLRELLYVIACNLRYDQIDNMDKNIEKIINKYIIYPKDIRKRNLVTVEHVFSDPSMCCVVFMKKDDLAKVAGVITFRFDYQP